jgi:peptidoglycan/xylan/chitin deacetylase (PgdA/CDA1 family)
MIKNLFLMLSAALVASSATTSLADQGADFSWPAGARAAVNLAYDDALGSQLDNAIPALNRYGLKGSFYLTLSGDTVRNRLDEWRLAARQGHELGNHTLFHQCSGSKPNREWVKPHEDLDLISADELVAQIQLASTMLHAIDGRTERTFTVPCGDREAAGEDYVKRIVSEFIAIKVYAGGVVPDMAAIDPDALGGYSPVEVSGEQLISVVKEAASKGTMANFTFHGIGGDHLSVSSQAHEELLQYLSDNSEVYWVDTLIKIMKYVESQGPE